MRKGCYMNSVKYIILDFGKVLAYPKTGYWFITPKFMELVDMSKIELTQFDEYTKQLNYILSKKVVNREEEYEMFFTFYTQLFGLLDYPYKSKELIDNIVYDMVYTSNKYGLYDGVKTELEELSKKYTLLLLSDNWPCCIDIMKEYGIEKFFDRLYISSFYGSKKSDEIFFDYPINDYKINACEAIFIDDNPSLLEIACRKGLDVRLMDRDNKYQDSEYPIIHNLSEIEIFDKIKCK